ncbi:hypothetical protein PAXRUDRAFT_836090 [Paxillus rubicundulus Ve08.2h10]|uniref:Unplaced genomic scaffold scaffold_4398, whole genome shotgun sequence n=1 Tax=Paxillus rubicundulus Ve08.2h10 TaxID=930991 RepID=A0A0D0BRB8_9AGAM|nr:hypothetical protein PAXRUDRAFT_836090 [Paxillus rubicundulus Ve08.2h10]
MRTFLTLAAITSLSAYTLVGVHAKCAICPSKVDGRSSTSRCTSSTGITTCRYEPAGQSGRYCYYNNQGVLQQDSSSKCPASANTGNNCSRC